MESKKLKYDMLKQNLEILPSKDYCYPFNGTSKVLIDKFLIIGYNPLFFEKILSKKYGQGQQTLRENIYQDTNKYDSQFIFKKSTQFYIEEDPLIINEISSNYDKEMLDNNVILDLIFPNRPIGYVVEKDIEISKYTYDIVFSSNPDSSEGLRKSFNGFAHIFYEKFTNSKTSLYLPKIFVFISEYPFFSSFFILSRKIEELFTYQIKIPIEFIIYNLIQFTPSPINCNVELDLEFSYLNKNMEVTNVKEHSINKLELNALSGYPLLEYNLVNVLCNLSPSIVFRMFLFTFLEKDIFVFSQNLELLNLTIFTFSNLNFPFNDMNYFWINPTVSLQTLISGSSKFVGLPYPTMLGVHSAYFKDNPFNSQFNDYFILDLDSKEFEYVVKSENEDTKDTNIIISYLKKIPKEKNSSSKGLLTSILKKFYNNYETYMEKFKYSARNKSKLYENVNMTYNKNIQEIFYNAVIDIISLIYKNISIHSVMDTGTNMRDRNRNNEVYYNEYNNNNPDFDKLFSMEEMKFIEQLKSNFKFSSFVESFVLTHSYKGLYQIPFLITEEFVNLKANKGLNVPLEYNLSLDVVDKLYRENKTFYVEGGNLGDDEDNAGGIEINEQFGKVNTHPPTIETIYVKPSIFLMNYITNDLGLKEYFLNEIESYHSEVIDGSDEPKSSKLTINTNFANLYTGPPSKLENTPFNRQSTVSGYINIKDNLPRITIGTSKVPHKFHKKKDYNLEYQKLSKNIKLYFISKDDYHFKYEHNSLDQELILKYIYKLNNIPKDTFDLYFPSNYQIKHGKFAKIDLYNIEELIENGYINSDCITMEYLLCYSVFNLFTVTRIICDKSDLIEQTMPLVSLISLDVASNRKYYKELFAMMVKILDINEKTDKKLIDSIGHSLNFIINNLRGKEVINNKELSYFINKLSSLEYNLPEGFVVDEEETSYDYELYLIYTQNKKNSNDMDFIYKVKKFPRLVGYFTSDKEINDSPMNNNNKVISLHFEMKNPVLNYETMFISPKKIFDEINHIKNNLFYFKNKSKNYDKSKLAETNDTNLFSLIINLLFYYKSIWKMYNEGGKGKGKKVFSCDIEEDNIKGIINLLVKLLIVISKSLKTFNNNY